MIKLIKNNFHFWVESWDEKSFEFYSWKYGNFKKLRKAWRRIERSFGKRKSLRRNFVKSTQQYSGCWKNFCKKTWVEKGTCSTQEIGLKSRLVQHFKYYQPRKYFRTQNLLKMPKMIDCWSKQIYSNPDELARKCK